MIKDDCIFCQIAIGQFSAWRVYEDETFVAFLDIKPINLGHTLIIPKTHCRNLLDMPTETLAKLGPVLKDLAQGVKTATGAAGINIGWNNEKPAGQVIFHSHVHIIPRFENDNLKNWPSQEEPGSTDLEQTTRQIKSALDQQTLK